MHARVSHCIVFSLLVVTPGAGAAQSPCYLPPTHLLPTPEGWDLTLGGDALFVADENNEQVTVYERSNGSWSETQVLTGGPVYFGGSLHTDGSVLAVGATSAVTPGEVRLFERSGGSWTLQAVITPPPGGEGRFGDAVAVDGNLLAVTSAVTSQVFVYRRASGGSSWNLVSTNPINGNPSTTVCIQGGTLLVGEPPPGIGPGRVEPFAWNGTGWTALPILIEAAGNGFARELALDGDRFVTSLFVVGEVLVYERNAGQWTLSATLVAPPGWSAFGDAVALEGDRLAVGGKSASGGVVQLLEHENGVWGAVETLEAGLTGSALWLNMAMDQGTVAAALPANAAVWDPAEAPVTYCSAGTTALGCNALIGAQGHPSATAISGFDISAVGLQGQVNGLFFFGTGGRQASPWGNGTSFQCVVPPVVRTGLQTAGGTAGACDGTLLLDMNAWMSAHPAKAPGVAAVTQIQAWFRDPQNTSNQQTALSDALEFQVCP